MNAWRWTLVALFAIAAAILAVTVIEYFLVGGIRSVTPTSLGGLILAVLGICSTLLFGRKKGR